MDSYKEIAISINTEEQAAVIIALLSEAGYDGFEESEQCLKAFIKEADFSGQIIEDILTSYQLQYSVRSLSPLNWNEEWEKNFTPVIIDDIAAIRAAFHPPLNNIQYEIIITPKMSFGTGHHATTEMMIRLMQLLDFKNCSVLDLGTGTGVLAILAEKMGAEKVWAIDNDEWSVQNATENCIKNDCNKIEVSLADSIPRLEKFDIILANLSLNALLHFKNQLSGSAAENASVVISGFYEEDLPGLLDEFTGKGFAPRSKLCKQKWCAVLMLKRQDPVNKTITL